jgi:hypothetical protein
MLRLEKSRERVNDFIKERENDLPSEVFDAFMNQDFSRYGEKTAQVLNSDISPGVQQEMNPVSCGSRPNRLPDITIKAHKKSRACFRSRLL